MLGTSYSSGHPLQIHKDSTDKIVSKTEKSWEKGVLGRIWRSQEMREWI